MQNSVIAKQAGTKKADNDWSPYDNNGGTVVAIAGDDYVIIAADTRLIQSYDILSRKVSKLHQLTNKCIMGSGGCFTDTITLQKVLDYHIKQYKFDHNEVISTPALASLLSTTLYGRRMFPYYTFNIIAGLDNEGHGAIYSYDAVGSFETLVYSVQGEGQNLIIPLLDSCIPKKNRNEPVVPLSFEESMNLIKESFTLAGETYCCW
ncbi:hypothetical protein WA158_006431 [Blastocystis sp. Blastoise]